MKNSNEIKEAISELETNLKMFESEKEKTLEYDNVKLTAVNWQITVADNRINDLNIALAFAETCDQLLGFLKNTHDRLEPHGVYLDLKNKIKDLLKSAGVEFPGQIYDVPTSKEWPESKMVAKGEYFEPFKELTLTFRNGKKYIYMQFPPDKWLEAMNSESIGKYVNAVIKPNFKCRDYDGDLPAKDHGLINMPDNDNLL